MAYLPLEPATKMKAAGYQGLSNAFYANNGTIVTGPKKFNWNYNDYITAPKLDEAANWLREVHGLHCHTDCSRDWSVWYAALVVKDGSCDIGTEQFADHDSALSACISHALDIVLSRT